MKKTGIFLCLIICLMCFSFGNRPLDEFLISFWGGPQDAAQAETIRRANFNTVMCRTPALPLCRLYNLKAILFDVTPQMALRLRSDPTVWGYALKDEPENHEFKQIAGQAEALRRADPDHPVYINLGWKADPQLFVKILRPQILSFDDYRWWWSNDFLPLLEEYRRISLAAGLPFLFWVEANTGPDSEMGPGLIYPADNMAPRGLFLWTGKTLPSESRLQTHGKEKENESSHPLRLPGAGKESAAANPVRGSSPVSCAR